MNQSSSFKTFENYKNSAPERSADGSVLIQAKEVVGFYTLMNRDKKKTYVDIDFSYLLKEYPNSFLDFSKPIRYCVGSLGTLWTLKEDGNEKSPSCFRLVTNKVRHVFKEELSDLGIKPNYQRRIK